MKKLLVILTACAMAGCSGNKNGVTSWSLGNVTIANGTDSVAMTYPVAHGGAVADSINNAVLSTLESGFCGENRDEYEGMSLSDAVNSFLAGKQADTVIAHMPYQIISEGDYCEKDGIYSVYLQAYYYTGGAHGITIGSYLNFDMKNGKRLSMDEIVTDKDKLVELNRVAFVKYLDSRDSKEDSLYLFIEPEQLPLPQNIGFDEEGLVMLYNQYEIAAYVFGQSKYVIPYSEVEGILKKY